MGRFPLSLCVVLFAAALVLAACSSDSGGTRVGAGGDTADASEAETTPDAPGAGIDTGPPPPRCIDEDGDGYGENCDLGPDCNDLNAEVSPGAAEVCPDRVDNDCDGEIDEDCPCEQDGRRECYSGPEGTEGIGVCRAGFQICLDGEWGPCIDEVNPTEELCDTVDNDCDGQIDEDVQNACGACGPVPAEECDDFLDNDCNGEIDDLEECSCEGRTNQPCYAGPPTTLGIGQCRGGVAECVDNRVVACRGQVLPTEEVCDGIDNDCDGEVDEGLSNACGVCGAPEPTEVCDGLDNDCDGEVDEGLLSVCGTCGPTGEPDECGNGVDDNCDGLIDEGCSCAVGDEACWPGPPAKRGVGECQDGVRSCDASGEFWGACDGAVLPELEVCDGLDNDCDGEVDEGPDGCSVCGGEVEVCDGVDNDCDGQVDEFLRNACGQCIAEIEPEEACGALCCDGVDNDCDGLVDEGLVNACGTCGESCWAETWGDDPSDWFRGESNGIAEDVASGLRLGASTAGRPFLWVANSGEATVSQVNTETGAELGRFPVGQSPSRTAVDFDGNVFVANRAFFAQGTVSRVDVEGCEGEDCVRYTVPVGPNNAVPRGIAIDEDGFPWVGTYNDGALRKLDPETGLILEEYFTELRVYGIAIDSEGIIWIANLNVPEFRAGRLGAFDTAEGRLLGTWTIPGCSNPYGIAVDGEGNVWLGNFSCNSLVKFNRESETFSVHTHPALDRTRGVAVDGEGFVWVASYGTDIVAKFDPRTDEFVGTHSVCSGPMGIGIANDGNIWVPCYNSNSVIRLRPDGTEAGRVAVGRNPYSYSDLTGFQLRNFTARQGTWTITFDCGFSNCEYDRITWEADVPVETEVLARARVSNDLTSWSRWAGPYNATPANLTGLATGRYAQVEISLRTSNREVTPTVRRVNLFWQRP